MVLLPLRPFNSTFNGKKFNGTYLMVKAVGVDR